jgi:uncharacterized protein YicC (UPF0701 family)
VSAPVRASATPEARALELLAEAVAPTRRTRPGMAGWLRTLVDRATLTARHRQYHIDVALLQAIHELERRRATDAEQLRNDVRTAFDQFDRIVTRLDDVEARASVAAALADEIAQNLQALSKHARDELAQLAAELARTTGELSREITGLRAEAGRRTPASRRLT